MMLVCLGSDGAIVTSVHSSDRGPELAGEELGQHTTNSTTFSAEQCCHPVATFTTLFWNPDGRLRGAVPTPRSRCNIVVCQIGMGVYSENCVV